MPRRPPSAAVVLAILAIANLLSYASRNAPFAVYDDLRAQFGVDDRDLGWLGTAFMLPHALATLPVGWLADRADRRRGNTRRALRGVGASARSRCRRGAPVTRVEPRGHPTFHRPVA